ncbi:hypothetical protein [Rhizobium rhizogenes]|uniref:hypothetical protein n=1 Tax=Rhizobium rhizogenes TaxID=359 RepID=UPI001573AD50|nr:hypothetical protein [Rhizobium rhizogenes]NTF83611.1 hypothetical protein [Rhizobium rhizogenes]
MRTSKISVLLPEPDASRFDLYCRHRGFKKSTLIVRLIKEFMEKDEESRPNESAGEQSE